MDSFPAHAIIPSEVKDDSRSSRRSVHFKEPTVVEVVGSMSLLA